MAINYRHQHSEETHLSAFSNAGGIVSTVFDKVQGPSKSGQDNSPVSI